MFYMLKTSVGTERRLSAIFLAAALIAACSFFTLSCGASKTAGANGAAGQVAGSGSETLTPAEAAKKAEAEAKAKAEAAAATTGVSGQPLTEAEKAVEAERVAAKAETDRIAALDVPAPILSGTAQGVYASAASISVSATISLKEAQLVYTLDGSMPGQKNGKKYSGAIAVTSSAVFKFIAFVPGGKSSRVVSSEYTINEVCAAPGGSGDGRRGAPLGDISAAIDKARSLGITTVKLASSASFLASLEISAPITLSGGWKDDFSGRSASYSVIQGKEFDSSSKKIPGFALRVSGVKADSGVKLDKIEFRGGAASYSAAIVVTDGATPAFADCRAFGGDGSYGYGAAVIGNAAPSFRSCRLSGGDGATSYGLSVDSARVTVASSFLLAGKGLVGGYGLSATDARVRVASSVVAGSPANVSYGAAFYNCKESRLESCTVVGGSGKEAAGVFISAGDPVIENCILSASGSGKSYGIIDNYGESAPSRLNAVAFVGCSSGYYYEADAKASYTAITASGGLATADGKALPKPKATGCAASSMALTASNDFATPADAILPVGKMLAGDAAVDIAGKARTEPWTIGAFEL